MWTCHFPHVCWTLIVGFTSPQHPVLLLRFYITLLALIRGTRDTEVGRMFRSHMIPLCLLFYLSFKVHHALPQKKNLFKASQGLLGWIWRVSTWKRVQKRIDWEWSWWPQFQSEVKQFHPSFLLCVSRVSNLGPGPMRYLLTSGIDNLHDRNGKPCQCVSCVGCHASVVAKTRGTSSLYNHILLDKDSEMLELGVRKYMILPIHEHMCQNMLDFHTSSKSSIHAAWAPNIVPNEAWHLWIASQFIDSNWCDPITLRRPEDLAVSSGVLNTSDKTVGRPASPLWEGILHNTGYGWLWRLWSVVVIVITEPEQRTNERIRSMFVFLTQESRIFSATCIQDHIQVFGNQE